MFAIKSQAELRTIAISSLLSCIYLSSIVTVISYFGVLYQIGNAKSAYILAIIFAAEVLKSFYIENSIRKDIQYKRPKSRKIDIRACMFLVMTVTCFFVGTILFGAPALELHEETLMLSTLLTLLTALPMILHSGMESIEYFFGIKDYSKNSIVEMHNNNAVLTVCGAWMGAVVIPLDWNAPWQVWPFPCYLGAVFGYILSNLLTVIKLTLMTNAERHSILRFLVKLIDLVQCRKN